MLLFAVVNESTKIAFEYTGMYWHSYERNANNKFRHVNKLNMCIKHGIRLITIFEDEWIIDQNKVKNNISRVLGVSSHVNADECDVKVDGQCVSLVEKHTEQVIAYAVFSKSRFNIEEEWEMTSYVVKDFMIVDNGLKRILDAFAETFAPSSITAFIDRRWNDGAEYENCGFKLVKTLDPQCWWFNKTTLHRYHENDFKRNIAHDLLN